MSKHMIGIIGLALLAVAGCSRKSSERVDYSELAGRLTNPCYLARLEEPGTALHSSFDPNGKNDDFNRPLRAGPAGWWVLADLKGPGYVSRFWFTGGDANHRVRLYFDGEKTPRVDMTMAEFCGKQAPFLPPLAAYENYCWYNYAPIPYARRLVIMVQEGATKPGGWPRIFHQINSSDLPKGTRIDSLQWPMPKGDQAALQAVRESWASGAGWRELEDLKAQTSALELAPGKSGRLALAAGPARVRELRVTPKAGDAVGVPDWDRLLRDVWLRIRWDGAESASVEAPLGDFFGSVWRRSACRSLYFGLSNQTLSARFPMPYAQAAEIELENQGAAPLVLDVAAVVEPMDAWDGREGYFHAAWRRSSPKDVGYPHEIVSAEGRGRYAGCILSVTTLDQSFWILEGDELMWRDGEPEPFWRGTGLEDYFNGGWYYQNVIARPLHGLPFKTSFRTVQYRVHLPDPVLFDKNFRMIFERGPDNASRGWLESVAWYYLERPAAAPATRLPPESRRPPEDQFGQATIMPELCNYERFGDYAGARGYIDTFLARYPDFPFAGMLRLRQAAYVERMQGYAAARPLYEAIRVADTNAAVQQQLDYLTWFHEKPGRALLGVYCNMPTRVLLDGKPVGQSAGPERLNVMALELGAGQHVLALQANHKPYPSWVQAYLRLQEGAVMTAPDWKWKVSPAGAWTQPEYDDGDWAVSGGTGVKGPPEEPYVWVEPNAMVDMQSRAVGLGAVPEWPDKSKTAVYRKVFEVK